MDEPGKVYPLFRNAEEVDREQPVTLNPESRRCTHRTSRLDVNARRVYCRKCNVELDPFTVLDQFAREYEHHREGVETVRRERKRLSAVVEELKREERNVRARIKRREPKNPAAATISVWRNHEGRTREDIAAHPPRG